MSEYQLQIFQPFEKGDSTGKYRFAVIDPSIKSYPANFVCLLPKKIYDLGKPLSAFGRIFGDKSSEFAVALLKEALKLETDEEVKVEIRKRLKILDLEKPKLTCSCCHQEFEEFSKTKYKRTLCKSCLEAKLLKNKN